MILGRNKRIESFRSVDSRFHISNQKGVQEVRHKVKLHQKALDKEFGLHGEELLRINFEFEYY